MSTCLAARLVLTTIAFAIPVLTSGPAAADWLPYCFNYDGSQIPCGRGPPPPQRYIPSTPPIPPNVHSTGGNNYQPDDGYTWENQIPGDLRVRWNPGQRSSRWPNMTASTQEGHWRANDGYEWTSSDPNDYSVRWVPGTPNRSHPHVHSADREGYWETDNGWRFVRPNDLTVETDPKYQKQQVIQARIESLDLSIANLNRGMEETLRQIRARSSDIWDAQRALESWASASEEARKQRIHTALVSIWDVSSEAMKMANAWSKRQLSSVASERITKVIDQYTRNIRREFRKIEPENRRFLEDAYKVIKNNYEANKSEYKFVKHQISGTISTVQGVHEYNMDEYIHATASLIEAANSFFPSKYERLITLTTDAGVIWIDNLYSFIVDIVARNSADKLSSLQSSDLKAIKVLSRTYEDQFDRKRDLTRERRQLNAQRQE